MQTEWRIERAGRDPVTVRARDVPPDVFDTVMFHADDPSAPCWRVVRVLGVTDARLELWTDDGAGWYHYAPHPGPVTDTARIALEVANRLPEEHIQGLLRAFQAATTVEHATKHEEALNHLWEAQREVRRTAQLVEQSVAKESVLDLDPGPLRDVAIALARDWRGNVDDLLDTAAGVIATPGAMS